MPYDPITFVNGQAPGISANRLNHMQTQYEGAVKDVLGEEDSDITEIKSLLLNVDTRNVSIIRNAYGKIETVLVRDGANTVATISIERGIMRKISKVEIVANGKRITYTIERDANLSINSVTKEVA
ncbi:hypothetical protein [Caldalkalibacillus mannanilyticus]|uniref:hypothetical protein n=1 Tax=Caldalkalibacillus mannanilyticus TaxID=1418 RepID=UPI00046A044C|nr:hypothetical protein [Caldalkalibacillus mannanilyticus]